MMRLDKFLSACGFGTRSEVKKFIKTQEITINGIPVKQSDIKVDEARDVVCVKGKTVTYEQYQYYLFHKPAGCVTAVSDKEHKTVMNYFPQEIRKGLSPVGRLDIDTEGLLVITDDGELIHHCISPSHHVDKTYYVRLDKSVPSSAIEQFQEGIDIGDEKRTLPAKLCILKDATDDSGNSCFAAELTIQEGRFHQVKRMFEAVGCKVIYLKRLSMGTLTLGDLPKGAYRKLSSEEVDLLRK